MDDNTAVKSEEHRDLGSFEFLKTGWWVWHIIAIVAIFYLGYLFGGPLFK